MREFLRSRTCTARKIALQEKRTAQFKRQRTHIIKQKLRRKMHLKPETRSAIMNSQKHSHKNRSPGDRLHFGMPRSGKELHSQANASWDTPAKYDDESKEELSSKRNLPQHHRSYFMSPSSRRNTLLEGADVQNLLSMLKSNDFAGEVDPRHHSQYFVSPEHSLHGKYGLVNSMQTTRQARQTTHRSDGHLLQVNKRR